jgi:hypothetical protein
VAFSNPSLNVIGAPWKEANSLWVTSEMQSADAVARASEQSSKARSAGKVKAIKAREWYERYAEILEEKRVGLWSTVRDCAWIRSKSRRVQKTYGLGYLLVYSDSPSRPEARGIHGGVHMSGAIFFELNHGWSILVSHKAIEQTRRALSFKLASE